MTIYDAGVITVAEAKDMQAVAHAMLEHVRTWLAQSHPELIKPPK